MSGKEFAERKLHRVAGLGKAQRTIRHRIHCEAWLLQAQLRRQHTRDYGAAHLQPRKVLQTPAKKVLCFSTINNQRSA